MGGACNIQGRGEVRSGFWRENLREREHLNDPSIGGRQH